jgi:hypothetical protein
MITTMQCTEISDQGGYYCLHFFLLCTDSLNYGNGSYSVQVNGIVEATYYDEVREVDFVSKLMTSFTSGNKSIEIGKFYDLNLDEIQ